MPELARARAGELTAFLRSLRSVRRFSSEPIPWEQHQHWFDNKLNDPGCVFFIALDVEGAPIGQMRFDVDGEEAVISVSLAEQFHGLG